jgi:hypothetical protein
MIEKLVKVQALVNKIHKDSTNPFHKSRYASINAILRELIPALGAEGIFLTQDIGESDSCWHVETIVWDVEAGESAKQVLGRCPIICAKANDPQAFGAAITYARRYSLQAAFSLWAADDDAESACDRTPAPPARHHDEDETYEGTPEQKRRLMNVMKESGISNPETMREIHETVLGKNKEFVNKVIGDVINAQNLGR